VNRPRFACKRSFFFTPRVVRFLYSWYNILYIIKCLKTRICRQLQWLGAMPVGIETRKPVCRHNILYVRSGIPIYILCATAVISIIYDVMKTETQMFTRSYYVYIQYYRILFYVYTHYNTTVVLTHNAPPPPPPPRARAIRVNTRTYTYTLP
jgi:hypothetical protein